MDVAMMQFQPGDPGMVDKIVYQLKSKGIFDQFRKECMSDVDTKPAYQNLHQRVEGAVAGFLATQEWRSDLNKNQLRDSLRKHIHESGFLDIGVERIVDQVVNPKIMTAFLPQIEDLVYNYVGIEKPKRGKEYHQAHVVPSPIDIIQKLETLKDLLPKDLDPISPESDSGIKDKEDLSIKDPELEDVANEDEKGGEEEEASPPFEPIEEINSRCEDSSVDSHLSGISGLTSHDSQMSNVSFSGNHHTSPSSKVPVIDLANHDSQLSKVSSGSRLSIVFSDDQDKQVQKTSSSPLEIDMTNDDSQLSKCSLQIISHDSYLSDNKAVPNQEIEVSKISECILIKDSSSDASNIDCNNLSRSVNTTYEDDNDKETSIEKNEAKINDSTVSDEVRTIEIEKREKKRDSSRDDRRATSSSTDSSLSKDSRRSDGSSHTESDKKKSDKERVRKTRTDSRTKTEKEDRKHKDKTRTEEKREYPKTDDMTEKQVKHEDVDLCKDRQNYGEKCEREISKIKIRSDEQFDKDESIDSLKSGDKSEEVANKGFEIQIEKHEVKEKSKDDDKIMDVYKDREEGHGKEVIKKKSKHDNMEIDANKEKFRHEDKNDFKDKTKCEDKVDKEESKDKMGYESKTEKEREKENFQQESNNTDKVVSKDKTKHDDKGNKDGSKDKLRHEDRTEKDKERHEDKIDREKTKYEDKLEKDISRDKVKHEDRAEKDKEKLRHDDKNDKVERESIKDKTRHEDRVERDKEKLRNEGDKHTGKDRAKHEDKIEREKVRHEERTDKDRLRNEDKSKDRTKHEDKIEKEGMKDKVKHEDRVEKDKDKVRYEDKSDKSGNKDKAKHEDKIEKEGSRDKDKEKSRHEEKGRKDGNKEKSRHNDKSERDSSKDRSKHDSKSEKVKSKQDIKDERSTFDDKSRKIDKDSKEKGKKDHLEASKSDEVDVEKKDKLKIETKKERSAKDKLKSDDRGRSKHDDKYKEISKNAGNEKDGTSRHDSKSSRDRSTSRDSKSKPRSEGKNNETRKADSSRDKPKVDEKSVKDSRSSKSHSKGREGSDKKRDDTNLSKSSRSTDHTRKDAKKKENKGKSVVDDHNIHHNKHSDDRRSTDRDSNGTARGRSVSSRTNGNDSQSSHSKRESSSSGNSKSDGGGNSESSGTDTKPTDATENMSTTTPVSPTSSLPFKKRPLTQQEEDAEPKEEYSCVNNAGKLVLKIKKPKIAANIFEVRKIMHLRKSMAKMERKRQKQIQIDQNAEQMHEQKNILKEKEIVNHVPNEKSDEFVLKKEETTIGSRGPKPLKGKILKKDEVAGNKCLIKKEKSVKGKECITSKHKKPELVESKDVETNGENHEPLMYFKQEEININTEFIEYVKRLEESDTLSQVSCDSDLENEEDHSQKHSGDGVCNIPLASQEETLLEFMKQKISASLGRDSGLSVVSVTITKGKGNTETRRKMRQRPAKVGRTDRCINPASKSSEMSFTKKDNVQPKASLGRSLRNSYTRTPASSKNSKPQTSAASTSSDTSKAGGRTRLGFKLSGGKLTRSYSAKVKQLSHTLIKEIDGMGEVKVEPEFSGGKLTNNVIPSEIEPLVEEIKLPEVERKSRRPTYNNQVKSEHSKSLDETSVNNKEDIFNVLEHGEASLSKRTRGRSLKSINSPSVLMIPKSVVTNMTSVIDSYTGEDVIHKDIVEVNVLEMGGDEYSSINENNNIDKSSSDEDAQALSRELISSSLQALMQESRSFRLRSGMDHINKTTPEQSPLTPASTKRPNEGSLSVVLTSGGSSTSDISVPTPESQEAAGASEAKRPLMMGRSRRVGLGRPPSKGTCSTDASKGRTATPPATGADFVMPLSPESDVSASGDQARKIALDAREAEAATHFQTSEASVHTQLAGEMDNKRHLRSSVVGTPAGRGQRYTSDDLYKPRPLFTQGTRRNRGQPSPTPTSANQEPVTNCLGKRRGSSLDSESSQTPKRTRR